MEGLTDAVVIVTGASTGIGRATARRFGEAGTSVVCADVNVEAGERTVELIEDDGGEATFVETDVSDAGDVEAMVDAAVETYGDLDVAFNNAGIEGETAEASDQTLGNWTQVVGVNMKGVFLGMKHEIPAMLDGSDGGVVVNNASIAGVVGFPNLLPYVASKHGVVGMTKAAAVEYSGRGVRVNAICPGVIETPMVERSVEKRPEMIDQAMAATPIGRIGQPEEIADAAVWLSSEASSFVTGESLVVDGGYVAQ